MTWDELPVGTAISLNKNKHCLKYSCKVTFILDTDGVKVLTNSLMSGSDEVNVEGFFSVSHFPQEFFE